MRHNRRAASFVPTIALATVVILTAAGCSSGSNAGAASSSGGSTQTITLYSAQHEQTTAALVAAFTKQTGIKVKVRNDDEDVLTAQIEQEGSRSPADVFYTENSPWLEQLDQKGLLSAVDAATLAHVPAADSGATGDWVGVSARVAALVYNTHDVTSSQLPKSVLDLADPQWKGKLDLAPSETDFWPVISSVARTYGDARALTWLEGLKANAGANDDTPDNETITSDVNRGSSQIGLINHYYFYRLRAELGASKMHAALAYLAPHDAGYVTDISGAAVLKSSKHQAAAQQFLDFITSTAGQTILAHSESFEYPIAHGVAANAQLTPLDQLMPNDFTVADLGTGEDAKRLLQQAQLI